MSSLPRRHSHDNNCHATIIRFIRQVLDRSGGSNINIISKIENEAGLENYDDILSVTDGVMVARGDLAMEVRTALWVGCCSCCFNRLKAKLRLWQAKSEI